jgi:hypothetical protein
MSLHNILGCIAFGPLLLHVSCQPRFRPKPLGFCRSVRMRTLGEPLAIGKTAPQETQRNGVLQGRCPILWPIYHAEALW